MPREYWYEALGALPGASGGLRRSKIGVLGFRGVRGGVRGPISGLPYGPCGSLFVLDPHLYRADALVGNEKQDPVEPC